MIFRYLDSSNPNGTTIKRPSVLAVFSNGPNKLEQYALVDSGADMSAMDYRVAEKLDLDLSGNVISSFGISGPVESVISRATIDIDRSHEHYSLTVPIRVLFSRSEYIVPTLIGRMGFFNHFKISFDEANQKILMKNNGQN